MQSQRPEGNSVSPFPTDSIASFLGYMQSRFSDLVASDARSIPGSLPDHQHQSNVNDDPSSASVNGTPRTMFGTIDVMNQHNVVHFIESPPWHRAG
jgi:hypothetical protein